MRGSCGTGIIFLLVFLPLAVCAAPANSHKEFFSEPFSSGPEVTKACLKCHEEAAEEVMQTSHWTWLNEQVIEGKLVKAGKKNTFNNYCTQIVANQASCTRCHAGYGYVDGSFDFSDRTKVDCLVCHDTTGTYLKSDPGGKVFKTVNLLRVAQNVGQPVRDNCGSCHFFGGGGDAVKHGDLDSSIAYPEKSVDVHMGLDGEDFTCQTCHVTHGHQIPGNSLGVSPGASSQLSCEDCHSAKPHQESLLNTHVSAVACQTCHIPFFAKEIPTKTWWDWSTAGDPERNIVKDKHGKPLYVQKKGDMKYGKMVTPEYAWFESGKAVNYVRGQKIEDVSKVLTVAGPTSIRADKGARIYPFKLMGGKQTYDPVNKTLLVVKQIGEDGFWQTFDWQKSAKIGMLEAGLPFSGQVEFIETRMFWRINHMVSEAAEALNCLDCHGDKGRLDWSSLGYPGDPMLNNEWARD